MDNLEIANKLGVDNRYLSARCSRHDGALLWVLREFLMRNKNLYASIQHGYNNAKFEDAAIDLMAELLAPDCIGGTRRVLNLMVKRLIMIMPSMVLHNEVINLLKLSPQYKKGLLDWLELDNE